MLEIIAEILAIIVGFFIELAIWIGLGLYLGLRSIGSEPHREKLRKEWDSGLKGKIILILTAIFWIFIIILAGYFWWPIVT
jgi:hypothetical protein